jgi:hypothetical protein
MNINASSRKELQKRLKLSKGGSNQVFFEYPTTGLHDLLSRKMMIMDLDPE